MAATPHVEPTGTINTPALEGRRYRTDLLGEQAALASTWQRVAYGLAGGLGLLILVLWHLAIQPRDMPVFIAVETATGQMQVVESGEAVPLRDDTIVWVLRTFVEVLRRVSPDKDRMQQEWKALFQKVTPRGFQTLSAYAVETNPLIVSGEVRVEVTRVLRQSGQTYDIRWRETSYDDQGTRKETHTYSGLFTWERRKVGIRVSREARQANPAGILLDTWSWSQES